ncbi:hypothetical protein RHMOL_Rhmol01G0176400 [Rhododendron molle]|nr:hypothetical protein RHMOL_Rhmol06G0121600 [Rhododendron molle]KAI8572156.1 hypothetical protein RHMOL_Rhmol01G0176400 [Rhododendron molle]
MDINDDNNSPKPSYNKGKNVVTSRHPWVEKYRPQSLADVAAHRDIVNTSQGLRLFLGIYRLFVVELAISDIRCPNFALKEDMKLSYLAQELISTDRVAPQSWCAMGNCYSLQKDHETALKNFQAQVTNSEAKGVFGDITSSKTACGSRCLKPNIVWRNCPDDYTNAISIWHPRGPDSFVSPGCIAVPSFEEPDSDLLYCVVESIAEETVFEDQKIWSAPDSYPWACHIYQVKSDALHFVALRLPRADESS